MIVQIPQVNRRFILDSCCYGETLLGLVYSLVQLFESDLFPRYSSRIVLPQGLLFEVTGHFLPETLGIYKEEGESNKLGITKRFLLDNYDVIEFPKPGELENEFFHRARRIVAEEFEPIFDALMGRQIDSLQTRARKIARIINPEDLRDTDDFLLWKLEDFAIFQALCLESKVVSAIRARKDPRANFNHYAERAVASWLSRHTDNEEKPGVVVFVSRDGGALLRSKRVATQKGMGKAFLSLFPGEFVAVAQKIVNRLRDGGIEFSQMKEVDFWLEKYKCETSPGERVRKDICTYAPGKILGRLLPRF